MNCLHTPGNWRVESLNTPSGQIHMVLATIDKYPSTVCTVEEYNEVPGFNANRLADALLLASVPTLLDALQKISKINQYDTSSMPYVVQVAKDAISKIKQGSAAKPKIVKAAGFDELPDSEYVRESQLVKSPKRPGARAILPFSAPTLWRYVKSGHFPAPVKLGPRVTCWQVGVVREWLTSQDIKNIGALS